MLDLNNIEKPEFGENNQLVINNVVAKAVVLEVTAYEQSEVLELYMNEGYKLAKFIDNVGNEQILSAELKSNALYLSRTNQDIIIDDLTIIPLVETAQGQQRIAAFSAERTTTQSSQITAADITTLKNAINAEAARRNGTGAVSARVTIIPASGGTINASDYNNLVAPLSECVSLLTNVTAGDYVMGSGTILADGMGSYTYLNNALTALKGYSSQTGINTGCMSSCTGLCSNGCQTTCSGGCNTTCSGCSGCGSGCAGSCSSCSSNCASGCVNSCYDDCC
jgi:hypothetical protein